MCHERWEPCEDRDAPSVRPSLLQGGMVLQPSMNAVRPPLARPSWLDRSAAEALQGRKWRGNAENPCNEVRKPQI